MTIFAEQSRESLRSAYREAWRRQREGLPLQPLQAQIVDVIGLHPEYHAMLERDDAAALDAAPDSGRENPFLHLGLHLALREQLSTNRPAGIRAIERGLSARLGSQHDAEHRMIEILATVLWEAQRHGRAPDEALYLQRLRSL